MTYIPYQVQHLTNSSASYLPAGHRLAEITWKTPTNEKNNAAYKKPASTCVAIPLINLTIQPSVLQTALIAAFEALQDAVIRHHISQHLLRDSAMNLATIIIPSDILTPEGVAAFQAAQATSAKLSKELLATWFDCSIKDQLEEKLALIPGMDEKKLIAVMLQHKTLICDLASPRAAMNEDLARKLQRAINLAPDPTDKIYAALNKKLEGFMKPTEDLLGISL